MGKEYVMCSHQQSIFGFGKVFFNPIALRMTKTLYTGFIQASMSKIQGLFKDFYGVHTGKYE